MVVVRQQFAGDIRPKFAENIQRSIRAKGNADTGESRGGSTIGVGIITVRQTGGSQAAERP